MEVTANLIGTDWGPSDPVEAANYVRLYYERWLTVCEQVPQTYYHVLRFDQLIYDPKNTLKTLFDYLGLQIETRVYEFAYQLIDDGKMACRYSLTDEIAHSILQEVRMRLNYINLS